MFKKIIRLTFNLSLYNLLPLNLSLFLFFLLIFLKVVPPFLYAGGEAFPHYAGSIGGEEWDIYLASPEKKKPLNQEENFEIPCVRKPSEKKKAELKKELLALEREYEKIAREMGSTPDFERTRRLYLEHVQYQATCEINCKEKKVIVILPGGNMVLRVETLIPEKNRDSLFSWFCK